MFKLNGVTIPYGQAFKLEDGTQIPANWWQFSTPEEKEAVGITEIVEDSPPDQTYYWVTENGDGTYTSMPKSTEYILAVKLEGLAAYRYTKEIAGTIYANTAVATDRQTQAMITGAALQAVIDPGYTVEWKTSANTWTTFSANSLIGTAQLIRGHVQACFGTEKVHMEALLELAGEDDYANLIIYDFTTDWPPTAADLV